MKRVLLVLAMALGFAMNADAVNLGAAASFGVLSSTFTANGGNTAIVGDAGYTTLSGSGTHSVTGSNHVADATYNQAGTDQGTALTFLGTQSCTFNFAPGAIDLQSDATHGTPGIYTPGVYCVTGAMDIGGGGTIILNGNGLYIFRSTGAFTSTANSIVTLAGGAASCDVFWTPAAATTLGANSTLVGTDIDDSGITVGSTVAWDGRALAFGGTVTTDTDNISVPSCAASTATATQTATRTATRTATATSTNTRTRTTTRTATATVTRTATATGTITPANTKTKTQTRTQTKTLTATTTSTRTATATATPTTTKTITRTATSTLTDTRTTTVTRTATQTVTAITSASATPTANICLPPIPLENDHQVMGADPNGHYKIIRTDCNGYVILGSMLDGTYLNISTTANNPININIAGYHQGTTFDGNGAVMIAPTTAVRVDGGVVRTALFGHSIRVYAPITNLGRIKLGNSALVAQSATPMFILDPGHSIDYDLTTTAPIWAAGTLGDFAWFTTEQ